MAACWYQMDYALQPGTSDGKQTPCYLFTPRYYHFNCCPVITPLSLELRAMTWSLTLYLKWSSDRIQKNNVNNSDCVHIISFLIYCDSLWLYFTVTIGSYIFSFYTLRPIKGDISRPCMIWSHLHPIVIDLINIFLIFSSLKKTIILIFIFIQLMIWQYTIYPYL